MLNLTDDAFLLLLQIESLTKKVQVLSRSLVQKEEQIGAAMAERDNWKTRAEAVDERKDKSSLQQLHLSLQEQYSLSQLQLAESNRERHQLQAMFDIAKEELRAHRQELLDATVAKEEMEMRLTIVTKDLTLCKQTNAKQSDDLSYTSNEASRLRMDCEDLREDARREKVRVESAQNLAVEVQDLLDVRSVQLAEALHQVAELRVGSTGTNPATEVQLTEDRRKLQLRVQELEEDQLM